MNSLHASRQSTAQDWRNPSASLEEQHSLHHAARTLTQIRHRAAKAVASSCISGFTPLLENTSMTDCQEEAPLPAALIHRPSRSPAFSS